MTPTKTHLTLKTIKASDKLREIECEKWYFNDGDNYIILREEDFPSCLDCDGEIDYELENIPAPTLADVLDNAEFLFSSKNIIKSLGVGEDRDNYEGIAIHILKLCQQDKPLSEIEEYIISNIK